MTGGEELALMAAMTARLKPPTHWSWWAQALADRYAVEAVCEAFELLARDFADDGELEVAWARLPAFLRNPNAEFAEAERREPLPEPTWLDALRPSWEPENRAWLLAVAATAIVNGVDTIQQRRRQPLFPPAEPRHHKRRRRGGHR